MDRLEKLHNINKMIGNTPLILLKCKYMGKIVFVYAKCEWYNLTGSTKDRVAYQIISDGYMSHLLKPKQKICEVTSGNMGISLSALGSMFGHKVDIYMPKNMSVERKKILKLYGANLIEVDNFKQGFDCVEKSNSSFKAHQFENISNFKAHYLTTAPEIYNAINLSHLPIPQCFVAGVGTSGTLMGVGTFLLEKWGTKIFAIEPLNARILSGVKPLQHHALQGLSDEIVPKLYNKSIVDNIIQISDEDAFAITQKLSAQLGLGVGISSGANFLGAILSNSKYSVTIFPDDNKKYLSGELTKLISTKLVDNIQLLDYITL